MSSFELPFCPDLVCPADARVLGYPYAELPDGTNETKGLRRFTPTRITQWPPPGTVLGKDSTTSVVITATDESNKALQCVWRVIVPPLVVIGEVKKQVVVGTYNETHNFTYTKHGILSLANGGAYIGSLFKMNSRLVSGLKGGKREGIKYPKRNDRNNGGLTTAPNQTKAKTLFEHPIPVELDLVRNDLPSIILETVVLDNTDLNNDTVKLYGQVESYW
jgi:hypothetical protein